MKFAGKLYAGSSFLGVISSDTLTGLKRTASKKCNNHYAVMDNLFLFRINDREDQCVTLSRINKKSPDNRIVRGIWK